MHRQLPFHLRFRPSLSFGLLALLLITLWFAGGASRADASGQTLVRGASWILLIVGILFGERPKLKPAMPVVLLLAATALLALLQLIPLPPDLWTALPGREMFKEAAIASGQPQPWRPLSLVPSATANALASLIVPAATFVFVMGLGETERRRLPAFLLGMVVASTFLGLLQFSGAALYDPAVGGTAGEVAGIFANRNHFALFAALGCLLLPAWIFLDRGRPGWRGPVGLGLILLFVLVILASGSRAGLILGIMALALGTILARHGIRKALRGAPRWILPTAIVALVGVIATFALISFASDRAVTINRILEMGSAQEKRTRALPTVVSMVKSYFPAGSGFGGFDPIFRIHEPTELLSYTYFNHAHNDLVEVVLDGGLPALLLLLAALSWWAFASLRAWRARDNSRHMLPKLGSAMLLLIIVASVFDYPARTPLIMAIIVVAAVWLAEAANRQDTPSFTSG